MASMLHLPIELRRMIYDTTFDLGDAKKLTIKIGNAGFQIEHETIIKMHPTLSQRLNDGSGLLSTSKKISEDVYSYLFEKIKVEVSISVGGHGHRIFSTIASQVAANDASLRQFALQTSPFSSFSSPIWKHVEKLAIRIVFPCLMAFTTGHTQISVRELERRFKFVMEVQVEQWISVMMQGVNHNLSYLHFAIIDNPEDWMTSVIPHFGPVLTARLPNMTDREDILLEREALLLPLENLRGVGSVIFTRKDFHHLATGPKYTPNLLRALRFCMTRAERGSVIAYRHAPRQYIDSLPKSRWDFQRTP